MNIKKGICNIIVGAVFIWLMKTIISVMVSPSFTQGLSMVVILVISAFILNVVGQYILAGIKRIIPSMPHIPSFKRMKSHKSQ